MIFEDFSGQYSWIETPPSIEYIPKKTINPRNIGYSGHPLYHVWNTMKQRCYNPNATNYKNYGGRGIVVCDEWHDFQTFLADMEPSYLGIGYHIDRINDNGNYCKENCRWLKASENIRRANKSRLGLQYKRRTKP
jgi:hypothetical protein